MGQASEALRKGSEGTAPLSYRLRSLSASVALLATKQLLMPCYNRHT